MAGELPMLAPLSTIVVVPRERFGSAIESLESLVANTAAPYALVYVDAGSPPDIARRLAELARQHDFMLIRCDSYLAPNQARNLALPHLATRYVALADNDVFFAPGWLTALERCAEETAADIVTPLTCIGQPLHSKVHHAGGSTTIIEQNGKRLFGEKHHLTEMPLAEVREKLVRGPTETCEFHCALVRASVFRRHGELDEQLLTSFDHTDLSMKVRGAGGQIFFEPAAVVTYVPKKLALRELPYFMLRWNKEWTAHTVRHFHDKWNVEELRDGGHEAEFTRVHRGYGVPTLRKRVLAIAGWRFGNILIDLIEKRLAAIGRRRFAGLNREITVRVVHPGRSPLKHAA